MRNLFIVLLFAALLGSSLPNNELFASNKYEYDQSAKSDSVEIISLLKKRDQQIKDLLGPKGTNYTDVKRQKLKNIINGIIDYKAMASYALANTWDTLSVEGKDEFVDVFSQVVRNQSLNKLDIYRADIQYKEVSLKNDTAFVETMAILDNVRTPVHYTMQQKNSEWVVIDFSIDGVSTAKSYKRSFQNIIKRKGYAALYNSLEKKSNS